MNLEDATVADVLAEVGDDPAKAAEALEAEYEGRARKTLLRELEAVVSGGADPTEHAHRVRKSNGASYLAAKRLRYQGGWIEKGDPVPGAEEWPRLESWVRQGWVVRVK